MPRTVQTIRAQVTEGNDAWLMARVVRADNVVVDDADLADLSAGNNTDLSVRVFDISNAGAGRDPNTPVFSLIASTVGPTGVANSTISVLTVDGFWDGIDDVGYNFKYQLQYDNDDQQPGYNAAAQGRPARHRRGYLGFDNRDRGAARLPRRR